MSLAPIMRPKNYFLLGIGLELVAFGLHGEVSEYFRGAVCGVGLTLALFCNQLADKPRPAERLPKPREDPNPS